MSQFVFDGEESKADKRRRWMKQYRLANREQLAAKQKQYQAENRERLAGKHRQYRSANRKQLADYQKRHRAENREQVAAYGKQYREANREQIAVQQKQYHAAHRRAGLRILAEIKLKSGCVDCGYDGHTAALDFDHVRGEKIKDVSRMVTGSREKLMAEIAKCEVRCANCHRIKTHDRRLERKAKAS
ncbi:hypothetical protein LCGC14_2453200 [marine sediment metagenome]|uniref:HNH domain-containing protein n=1 Tax=marine sediment metagenome TaxID=412755 RepID=A0A0F9E9C7_9ZZZZ